MVMSPESFCQRIGGDLVCRPQPATSGPSSGRPGTDPTTVVPVISPLYCPLACPPWRDEEDLTQSPCIPWSGAPASQRVGIALPECATLPANDLISDDHAAFGVDAARQARGDKTEPQSAALYHMLTNGQQRSPGLVQAVRKRPMLTDIDMYSIARWPFAIWPSLHSARRGSHASVASCQSFWQHSPSPA